MIGAPTPRSADDDMSRLRIPPHSIEAEQSVLGGLMLDNGAWDRAADLLEPADFYRYEHRVIYAAVSSLLTANKPADALTVCEHLQDLGEADAVGGLVYINSLVQSVPSAANIRRYAELVRERSILRNLIRVGDQIATSAISPKGRAVAQIVDEAEAAVMQVGEAGARTGQGFVGMETMVVQLLDRVQELADSGGGAVTGVPTGFFDLDRMLSGLQPGDLVVLAARPSMGKTSLALNIAEHVAVNERLPVAVFSMEMSAQQLAMKIAGSLGRIDQSRLRTGNMQDADWGRLTDAVELLRGAEVFIDETASLSPAELRARARRLARQCKGKLGLIVVDYLQLMTTGGTSENRATEVGEISRGLKALAKELKCPVIALSQLNRGVEQRADKRPLMSDLRESGAIEQDADVIAFIYRDDYYNKDSKEPGVAEILIAKQRCGPTGTVKLAFLKPLTKFENLSTHDAHAQDPH